MLLAPDYKILASSDDPQNVYTGSPSLAQLPSGRLIAGYEWFRQAPLKENVPDQMDILASDDNGDSWRKIAAIDFIWPSPFVANGKLYVIGNRRKTREICISRSDDEGATWSDMVTLFEGRFHCAPTNVLIGDDFVYRAFETCVGPRTEWKSLVVAGDLAQDLLDPSSWCMSNQLTFPGVPDTLTQRRHPPSAEDKVPHDSWLEGNIIDVNGELRVVLRTIIDGHITAGLAAVCSLEHKVDEMKYRFVQFYPMPGAQCKFHIVHDQPSDMFWTAVTLPTDTWQDREPMHALGFQGPPGNERRILTLMYSLDALNWFQAGCVVMDNNICNSFSYSSQLITGDDLLVLARTSQGGRNQHDTNLITLHRIQDFRSLALDLKPEM